MMECSEDQEQQAFSRGRAMKQLHSRQGYVIEEDDLITLAADIAQLFLHQDRQRADVPDMYQRAASCARAFRQGYLYTTERVITHLPKKRNHTHKRRRSILR